MTEVSNKAAYQAPPATTNNDSASTSAHSPLPSKSPQQILLPPSESALKPSLRDSQPMTTSSSSSSLPPDQQMETTGASPYGTRSRNRTGNPRPNYAEDRELDMELEWTSGRKSQSISGSAAPSALQTNDSDKNPVVNLRRSSGAVSNGTSMGHKATIPTTQQNSLPGMSTFSAYPDPNVNPAPPAPTRKRKAPGGLPTSSHSSSLAQQPSAMSASRRVCSPPQASRLKSTNLMTFENCQGYLKNGMLKADDGTILAVNGKC